MSASLDTQQTIRSLSDEGYKYGFVTDIESDSAPPGLDEDTVRFISAKKGEPEWLLEWRLAAFRAWREMIEPEWAKVEFPPIDFQAASYYSAPKQQAIPKSLDEVDPELLRTYEKLGIPLREREVLAGVAVDAVFDSVSVATTFKEQLLELGIIFCSFGDAAGKGGIYNFVTKRGACRGARAKISWTQVETGSAITWKYPSCILEGDDSVGEFYSVAITNNRQQADTGTKMIHIGRNTSSTIISKGISAGRGQNTYRGLVRVQPRAQGARNYTQCDSLLIGDRCGAHTVPYIEIRNPSAKVEHEATTSKISEDQLFYCRQRGIKDEDALSLIVNGFCKEVLKELPMEFAVEAQKLLAVSLEGSVG